MEKIIKGIRENEFEIWKNGEFIGLVNKIDGLWYWHTKKETSLSFNNFNDAKIDLLKKIGE